MDSFHECLQEYGEGLEVVQICLEPEEASIKDDELSALGDLSFEDCKKIKKDLIINVKTEIKINGVTELKFSKSDESLDEHDDDMTITEDDILVAPRELQDPRSKSADRKEDSERCLSKQQSKDISTSDEMVFAVTPTGLERISFDKYWKESDVKIDKELVKVKSDESWKECLNSPHEDTVSFYDATTRISVQEENNSLLYIDHEIDGYETCLDEDSSSQKCTVKNARKMNGDTDIKEFSKHEEKIAFKNKDNDVSAKIVKEQITANATGGDYASYSHPYVHEHIIKQMKSLRIEPLNVTVHKKKKKEKSPTKPSKKERIQCVEYYNDQAECLKEIRQQKLEEEEKKHKTEHKHKEKKQHDEHKHKRENKHTEHKRNTETSLVVMDKTIHIKQEHSEESTDLETNYVPGCHKCFLENYAYAITQAYMAEANACKYCDVIREMLEVPKSASRRGSAPALVNLDSSSETDEEDLLMVPMVKDRRKSAGILKFPPSSRRPSFAPPTMTVTVSSERRADALAAQRWGSPRQVTLKRSPGAPLGVSIVGGKVDIISNRDGDDGEEKAIFGIFIKNVVPGSPAGNCGELQTGDRILEVDGVCVRSAQHERAVQLIKAAGDTVTLTVQSLLAWNTDSSDVEASTPPASPTPSARKSAPPQKDNKTPQHEIKITVTSEANEEKEAEGDPEKPVDSTPSEETAKQVYSDDSDSSDDEEDERELQGRTYSDKGVEIDRASAGAVKRSKEEKEADPEEEDDFGYTTNKIRKKYAGLGDSVVSVRLERSPRGGLGLSLAGHRDRSRMAVFVCGLHPAGAAAKAVPAVKVGDEILEVNGIVLHGRCHLNASAIIKGLVGPIFKIILLRRKAALEDVAVKPLTPAQFPVALEEESSEDRFAGYKGVRDITIKKGPSGLGIMIIEGRHTEAGRGIFVSDLQEGSAAEQGGLQIGDMLLAVNRDSLLNCSYDAAAAKLKQTEGVVVLTVCTPNLKEPGDDSTATTPGTPGAGGPSAPGGASRPASRNANEPLAASRPQTPRPTPSPVKVEPPPDPATAPVAPNVDTVIEINSANEVLGVLLLGGSDTLINGAAAIILDVYNNGAIAKDGRLKPGDQILECNGIAITKEMAHERVCLTIKQKTAKLKLTVHRPEPLKYEEIEIDLSRKAGKALGLTCVAPVAAPGVYIGQLLPGTPADMDGRIQRGDFLMTVDGKDVTSADLLGCATALKLCANKATIKVKRFKTVR